jgi:hypothetical protein
MTRLRQLATVTTFAGLASAIGVSLAQMLTAHGPARLEPTTQMLALIAALTGIAAERFAAERQRRRQALATLVDELHANRAILDEMLSAVGGTNAAKRRVYPRLVTSAAEGTIASGALADDRELLARLHEWHNAVVDCNRRLDLTEMLTFLQGDPAIRTFDQALSRDDGRVQRISRLLDGFLAFLDQNHREHRWTGRRGSDAGTGWQPTVVMTVGRSGRAKPAIPQPVSCRRSRVHLVRRPWR